MNSEKESESTSAIGTGTAKRFDQGKLRYDLVPNFPYQEMARVLTFGCSKYGERNWEKGMKWSRVLGSLERHLQAIKNGEDYDPETGILHSAHVMCNAMFLTHYYKVYPEGDDRPRMPQKKIGLDIDEVLADFVGHYTSKYSIKEPVESWNFDPDIKKRLDTLKTDKTFWETMPAKVNPADIPFEPTCYISSRVCSEEMTRMWLKKNGFPMVPVYHTTPEKDKIAIAKEQGLDIFVDDRYTNFKQLNDSGICCFLFDAPHNQRYNVGARRIKSLTELSN